MKNSFLKHIRKLIVGPVSLVVLLLGLLALSGCDSGDTSLSLSNGVSTAASTPAATEAAVSASVSTSTPEIAAIASTEAPATAVIESYTSTPAPEPTNTDTPPTAPAETETPAVIAPTATAEAAATSTPADATPTSLDEQPATPTSEAAAAPPTRKPVTVNGRTYDAYLQAATKKNQVYHYSCEFDSAWVVLKTYGFDVSVDQQLQIVGLDTSVEPYYKETPNGVLIYGGDITNLYSGDYKTNFLARSTGSAMRKVFERSGLTVTAVNDKANLEAALLRGELIWIKTTVDFKPGRPATWVMPDGSTYQTVLGNDHAVVVIGFNSDVVVIRDVLGPTSTNLQRKYEYEVPWSKFMASWASQSYDGLAVAPPAQGR